MKVYPNQSLLFFSLFILFIFQGVFAKCCSTDLVAFFGKVTTSEKFANELYEILQNFKIIGVKLLNAENVNTDQILNLKKIWLNFELNYKYSPPVWAQQDKKWNEKFENLLNLLKEIENLVKENNFLSAHEKISSFSRIAISLLEFIPQVESNESKSFVYITIILQKIFETIQYNNLKKIPGYIAEIKSALSKINIDKNNTNIFDKYANLMSQVNYIDSNFSSTLASDTILLSRLISDLEKSFEEFVTSFLKK